MQNLSEVENAALGAAGGVLEVTAAQAPIYWKNAKQQGMPFTLNPRLLYRGYTANVIMQAGTTCVCFVANGWMKKLITGETNRPLTPLETLSAAFASGVISSVYCSPLELLVVQQQKKGGSLLSTAINVIKQSPLTMLRGLSNTAGREGIYAAGYLGLGPLVREMLRKEFPDTIGRTEDTARVGGAIVAGVVSTFASHPFDTVKTCMQGDVERTKFGGMSATYKTLYNDNGIRAFYRGVSWRCLRLIMAVFILDKSRIELAHIMFPHKF